MKIIVLMDSEKTYHKFEKEDRLLDASGTF